MEPRTPEPAAPEINITWDTTRRHTRKLSNDDARKLFGLGGTCDEDLAYRIAVLTQDSPELLRILMNHPPDSAQTMNFELRTITAAEDDYPLWPGI